MNITSLGLLIASFAVLLVATDLPQAQAQAEPILGEMKWVPYNFAPRGWAECDGQLLPVSQNSALFSLLGTRYGGDDDQTTFRLPDVQGRTIIGAGNGNGLTSRSIGDLGDTENVALSLAQMPSDNHNLQAFTGLGDNNLATSNVLARGSHSYGDRIFSSQNANVDMHSSAILSAGGNQPHTNLQPHLVLTCIIALFGIFPSDGFGSAGEPMISEIRWFAHDSVPENWHRCDGSLLFIADNPVLFSLLGSTYGGDGRTTFGVPDLQGRSGLHPGNGPGLSSKRLGETGGTETETLSLSQIPSHNHQLRLANVFADNINTNNHVLSNGKASQYHNIYHGFDGASTTNMGGTSLSSLGDGLPHENMFPFNTATCVIATEGLFLGRDSFVGELAMYAGNLIPDNWARTDGQLLATSQNDALFSLLGTTYGGDGRTTFGLPELRGRIPVHMGLSSENTQFNLGSRAGAERVFLNAGQMPSHTPTLRGFDGPGDSTNPSGNVLASGDHPFLHRIFSTSVANEIMSPSAISSSGGSQSHNNISPFKGINYIIALQGTFPSPN